MEQNTKRESIKTYFHNLKFDGEFILNELFRRGFTHNPDGRSLEEKEFSTLISDTRLFYEIKICFGAREKNKRTVTINDSLKIIPFAVEDVARAFNLPLEKLEIDYTKYREPGYQPTEDEIKYLGHDCKIVGLALKTLFEQGMDKMTAAGNALAAYKVDMDKSRFRKIFPVIECDHEIRQGYRGGYVYCNPLYQGQITGSGNVYDVNSLYPFVMRYKMLPYGEPKEFTGKYQEDKLYPLHVSIIRCQFKIRDGFVPMVQIKKSFKFREHEYCTDTGADDVVLTLTSVDLEMFLKHYEVYNLDYIGGYKFRGSKTLFAKFVDKWMEVKVEAENNKNTGLRTLAKLTMNSLYGKWATSPRVMSAIPRFDHEQNMVEYDISEPEEREPLYVPVAAFITAYARQRTIQAIQANFDRFLYCDTDSIHLLGDEEPKGMEVNKTKLGAWKHEMVFSEAKYLRAKCYLEIGYEPGKPDKPFKKVTIAGMSKKLHKYVTMENFKLGAKFTSDPAAEGIHVPAKDSNLRPMRVSGGIVLVEKEFTLREVI